MESSSATAEHRPATEVDAEEILSLHLSPEDLRELQAASPLPVPEILTRSIEMTPETRVVTLDGLIVAVFGIAPHPQHPQIGIPWFLSTGELHLFSRRFLRESRRIVLEWLQEFPTLVQMVSPNHTKAVRWLRFLGFERLPQEITLHDPEFIFHPYQRTANV